MFPLTQWYFLIVLYDHLRFVLYSYFDVRFTTSFEVFSNLKSFMEDVNLKKIVRSYRMR